MINVQAQVIDDYLTDSVNKEIEITHEGYDVETLNYYTGDLSKSNKWDGFKKFEVGYGRTLDIVSNIEPTKTEFIDYMHSPVIDDWDYLVISFFFKIDASSAISLIDDTVQFDCIFNGSHIIAVDNVAKSDLLVGKMVTFCITRSADVDTRLANLTSLTMRGWFVGAITQDVTMDYLVSRMSINYTRHTQTAPSPWESAPLSWDVEDLFNPYVIDNNTLIYEDFSLTESLCSQKNIKFGLCEAAHCEFKVVNNAPQVGDKITVKSSLPDISTMTEADLEYINWINVSPDATFNKSYTNQTLWSSPSIYSVAIVTDTLKKYYNEYFANRYIGVQFGLNLSFSSTPSDAPTYFTIYAQFHGQGDGTLPEFNKYYLVSDFENKWGTVSTVFSSEINGGECDLLTGLRIRFYKADKTRFAQADVATFTTDIRRLQYHSLDAMWDGTDPSPIPAYDANAYLYYEKTLDEYIGRFVNTIPLGIFTISSVSREYAHNLVKRKIEAYDNLVTLEDNAADWYTRYMFGVDFYGYTDAGIEFARQIFSTYWNYISSVGLDSIVNYEITDVATLDTNNYICDPSNCYGYVRWDISLGNTFYRTYGAQDVAIDDNTLLYRVVYNNFAGMSDEAIMQSYNPYYVDSGFDTMWRGFGEIGGVLIEEYKTGTAEPINRICVNRGDFFMLTPDTDSIKVILPSGSKNALGYSLCQDIKVQSAPRRQDLTNGHLRLCYYNYDQKTIFACESNITGRDVVRSLLEVCGCFFRLDRYNGLPEFVYPTKGGLYPSNTLYPADDLYPRSGTDQLYSMGKYLSVIAENYEVKDYGRIQILKNIKSSDTKSVVEWQYEGDPDMENTYIIDDNIFYCAEEMEYDYDGMPEVAAMLEGMWGVISNLGYVPNITQALGAPWLECGDRVGLLTFDGGFETFVFRRTLKGIQNLKDTYESEGDEINVAISNFGYSV